MKLAKYLFILLLSMLSTIVLTSCEKDDDYLYEEDTEMSDIAKPIFDKDITTTTTSDVTFRARFNNGGDKKENMYCLVYWRAYSKKPNLTPGYSDMNKSDFMRVYSSTSTKTTFDQAHSGMKGGYYIYYYFECTNSKGTTNTDIMHTIIKR